MLITTESTISDIVRDNYRAAGVFKKHGINFCCSGMVSLLEACAQRQLNYHEIIIDIEEATRNIRISNQLPFSEWKIDFLIDYIINVHHAYVNMEIPLLETSMISFIDGHKKKYPELEKILTVFQNIIGLLLAHNRHEEEIIFPYMKQIEIALRRKESYGNLFVRTLRKPLSNIEQEHKTISSLLEEMKSLTNNYRFPQNACTNHQVIYHRLKAFHDDLVQHTHLEHNILFPRAVKMEMELLQQ